MKKGSKGKENSSINKDNSPINRKRSSGIEQNETDNTLSERKKYLKPSSAAPLLNEDFSISQINKTGEIPSLPSSPMRYEVPSSSTLFVAPAPVTADPISLLVRKVQKEAFLIEYVKTRSESLLPEVSNYQEVKYDLQLNVSEWLPILDEDLIQYCCPMPPSSSSSESATGRMKMISLVLKDITDISIVQCELLGNLLGPRIVELVIDNCPMMKWATEMKALMTRIPNLQSMRWKKIPWLDDVILESLIKRYKHSLNMLEFERCHRITNNGLFQIGKYSTNIGNLFITCCNKITDVGLMEISKKNHILNIELSHCLGLGDKGIEALLMNSAPSLYSFSIINCANVTNHAVSFLYEISASWGKRRNSSASTIQRFIVRDNPNFTEEALLWVTASARDLVEVDLRDCPNIEYGKAILELASLSGIKYLRLGCLHDTPSSNGGKKAFRSDYFIQGIIKLIPNLTTLQIINLPQLRDDQIAEIFDHAYAISDLSLVKLTDLGTASVESICSNLPNLSRLEIAYSNNIRDIDLRCITSVCLHLKAITVSHCPQLTDAGFTRFVALRYLEEFHIHYLSKVHLTSLIVKFLSLSPVQKVSLHGVRHENASVIGGASGVNLKFLKNQCRQGMREISLKESLQVTQEDIQFLLNHFVFLERLDLTNLFHLSPDVLKNLQHFNPFLELRVDPDFVGFALTPEGQLVYRRYLAMFRQLTRHIAAKKIQKLRRSYLKRLEELKVIRKENWLVVKEICIIRIQKVFRGYRVRKEIEKQRNAVGVITRYVIKFFMRKGSLKLYRAKTFYREYMYRKYFRRLLRHQFSSKNHLEQKFQQLKSKHEDMVTRKYFALCKVMQKELTELAFEQSAMIIYYLKYLKKILFYWRKVTSSGELQSQNTLFIKQRLIKTFLAVVPLSHYNSIRQERLIALALAFEKKRILTIAWIELAKDRLAKRRIDKMIPMAIEYARRKFFQRVVGKCYGGLTAYYKKRLQSKRRKLLGEQHYERRLYRLSVGVIYKYYCIRKFMKIAWMKAKSTRARYLLHKALTERFHFHTLNSLLAKDGQTKAIASNRNHLFTHGYMTYKLGILRDRKWREMNKIAELTAVKLYNRKSFKSLVIFKTYNRNIDAYYYRKYLLKLCRKILLALQFNVAMERDRTNLLVVQLKRKTRNQEHFLRLMHFIQRFQAVVRGRIKKRKFAEERIEKLFAIQTLQNFFRVVKARKEYMSRLRKEDIAEKVREDTELDLMRDEEAETRYYLYKINAIVTIQRCFRGHQGRKIALIVAYEMRKFRGKQEYIENQHLREHHEAFLRAQYAKEKIRANAAIEIQRVWRGRMGRKIFADLQYQKLISKTAVSVQHAYQVRLAQLQLKAIKRDSLTQMRHLAARRQRGMVLRLFGLAKRKYQNMIAPMLESLGIDPISFNYRFSELVTETVQDFEMLLGIYHRERDLFKKHGINRLNRLFERRQILAEQGFKYKLHDAVRIIEPGHAYYGLTGVIVRIDETLVGYPLYEIRLDRYFGRQTFLRMTTDPLLTYEQIQPLTKIQTDPIISGLHEHQYPAKFGLDATNEFYSKKNVYAAWTIQRAFRMHRSRRIVARVRYEHWRKNINRHHSLLLHLSESNALTTEGYRIAGILQTQSRKPIKFNELKQKLYPLRYTSNVRKLNELNVINKEMDMRFRDRMTFLQKSTILGNAKENFSLGFRKMTTLTKFQSLVRVTFGLIRKGGSSLRDLFGARSLKYLANQKSMVIGLDKYTFSQFHNSRHVRYHKASVYQGEWSGIPLFTPLRPHGEGMIFFLDGWGFAREDKVLYLTIVRCKYLNAVELTSSDPYCDIYCNGHNLQTAVKWRELNPEYHESFEIDVTNPQAELTIQVKSHDLFWSIFLGQIVVKMSDLADGKEHHLIQLLKGENPKLHEDFDRGEIEIRLKWAERVFEDDQIKLEVKKAMLIRLQSWFRRISALVKLKELRKEREKNLAFIRRCAIKITSTCRIRLARKEYKRRSRKFKAATKIQKRVRIWIARRLFRLKKLHYSKARKIQTAARVWLARRFIARIKQEIADSFDRNITLLQKNVRRYLALKWYGAKKKEIERFRRKYLLKQQQQAQLLKRNSLNANAKTHALDDDEDDDETEDGDEDPAVAVAASAVKNEEEKEDDDIIATIGAILGIKETIEQDENNIRFINSMNEQVEDWIGTYGKDAEYGLKRNRRITERLFQKILRMRLARIVSRFGIVYVDSYPPRKSEEELLQEMNNSSAPSSSPTEPLTNREDFASVYFPMFQPVAVRKAKAMEMFHRFPHTAILHLPTSIDMRASVNYNITTIQCFIRQRKAKQEYNNMMKVHKAIALFQRIFRRRYERFHKASILIVSLFRMILSKVRVRFLKREKDAAMTIQNSFRCYRARSLAFDLRSVSELSVLKASPDSAEYHGPERVLEHRSDTFWMANTIEKAEIRIEFLRPENVIEVWIMTSTFSASPTHVTISVLTDKKEGYNELFEKVELPLLKGDRWHKFKISTVLIAKYFMVTFYGNYGDSDHISVRQVRFLKSKEKSVEIIKQPSHYILDAGPMVGTEGQLELFVLADSWPKPTYQWYRNGMLVEGATDAKLVLSLFCEPVGSRTYRCIRCKMSSKKTPYNAYHIQCGNCAYLFTYKDVEDFDAKIAEIRSKENDLHSRKTGILTSKVQMESFQNAKYKALVKDLNEQLHQIEQALQLLREERYFLKQRSEIVNDYPNEGIYTCVVQNIRGGSIKMKKTTIGAVVLVERPTPYIVDVIPYYQPRPQTARKKWSIYTSLVGTFIKGRLDGLVLIRYHDGSYYEGPYVPEDCINEHGLCDPERKLPHHYGRYYLADGRIFEGFNVDNHFDPYNLQLFYRLTLPNGETYEGNFCDETYHGIGLYTYLDGSVYEGRWHRGTRFGHGQLRSSEGWTYEGFFDKDRRHRQGVISFPDGSCYMGDFYYDSIQGKGIYITHLRDVYKGEMKDGKYHGHGEMLYSDGSTYVGEFQNGLRHGRGVFMEREGSEYYGHWKEDLKIGEHIVKIVIPIEEKGQDNYEIRIGIYDDNTGELVKWKSRFSNPIATKQFIHLFKQNRDMFDSVYSMILAKHLPNLPEGIDANNKIVKNIIFKIRTEAGMLVGQQALIKAKQQLDELMIPLQDQTNLVNNLKTQIENLSLQMIAFEKEANDHYYKFLNLISKYEKDTAKIEQLWLDEPKQTRKNFYIACKKLYNISVDEYFAFRNHRVIPVFVKKILDAISYLLGIPNDWKEQQMIISDAVANGRNGDEEALRLDYHCKLAYLMKDYEVYKYLKIEKLEELRSILADVRFRSDSFYIEATGPPGPVLVEWAKANYAYISSANDKFRILSGAEEKKLSAYRFKAAYNKKKEEMEDLTRRIEETRHQLQQAQLELEDIQHAVLRANDLLQFITGRFNEGNVEGRQDYYKILEKKLEEKKDFFTIEVCMQSMCDRVIERYDKEQNKLRLQAYSMGVEYHEPIIPQGDLVQWIREEVLAQQEAISEKGRTLGYSLINERLPTDITLDYMTQVISLVVDIIIGKMNDHFNDLASSRSWISMKGRKFNSRFIYIYTWKVWEEEGLRKRDQEGINAWERIFVDVETCTIMAIEARVNNRMSALARAQGITWGLYHPTEIAQMEEVLAKQFEEAYMNDPSLIVDGAVAIEMDTLEENPANQNPDYPPRLRAQCQCWIKLHPNEVTKQKDNIALQFAQEFEDTFPKETGLTCFRILNNIAADDEMIFYQQAVHWKEFHMDEYEVSLKQLLTEMSKDFIEAFPLNSYYESAKYIEKYYMSQYLFDQQETYHAQYLSNPTTTLPQEFVNEYTMNSKMLVNAYAYRMLNQGMYSKGLTMFMTECQVNFLKQWNDLILQTDQWQKGNAMMFGSDEAGNDRFYGFRVRLYTKFVFLIIFLYRQKDCIIEKLSVLAMKDPIYKIKHRVRPSQLQQVSEEVEMNYLTEKLNLETQLQDVMVKISMWNTYFGIVSESDYYPQQQGVNESSMIEEQRSHIE